MGSLGSGTALPPGVAFSSANHVPNDFVDSEVEFISIPRQMIIKEGPE